MKESLEKILNYYGYEAQTIQAIEEMAELSKELCKYLNGRGKSEKVIEEMADVQIMLNQLKLLFYVEDDELEKEMQYKVARTLGRINK